MRKIFDYNQNVTINASPALAKYSQGACLSIAMKWCLLAMKDLTSATFGASLVGVQLAKWMSDVQDVPLETLALRAGYRYLDGGGDAISDVGTVRGKINNMQAYAWRLTEMSSWARNNGLKLSDDRYGFPGGATTLTWVKEMLAFGLATSGAPVIGIIGLTGSADGHALGFGSNGQGTFLYFDPNEGEYQTASRADYETSLAGFVTNSYRDLQEQWWAVKFITC
jgi:hypothetical protein